MMLAIGLMSGTSLDGCDVALVEINENDKFTLKDFYTLSYSDSFRNKLKRNLDDTTAKLSEICSLNFELGYKFKEAVDYIINKNSLKYNDIEFVCSHGQTIWHNPFYINDLVPSTLQIGTGQVISTLTGIKTITNLRIGDIIAGGQGAPLVPMFEYLYFKDKNKNVLLQNLGGIGNVTYLKKGCSLNEVIAFDTGPGNVMIDYFMNKYYNIPYDLDSKVALSGIVLNNILEKLIDSNDYLQKTPPKSTGRELYSAVEFERLSKDLDFNKYAPQDIICTITEYTVYSIIYNYKKFIVNFDKVIVSGGGSHNKYIMKRLKEELKCDVLTADEATGIKNFNDAKEAFAFAVLGYLSLTNRQGNVESATGAKYGAILGEITLAKRKEEK